MSGSSRKGSDRLCSGLPWSGASLVNVNVVKASFAQKVLRAVCDGEAVRSQQLVAVRRSTTCPETSRQVHYFISEMDFLFVANDGSTDQSSDLVGNGNIKTFPEHPGERPSKVAHKRWATKWRASLSQMGYAAPLRGEEPYEVKKLQDRPRIPDPGLALAPPTPSASIASENAKIDHQNALNKLEREARMDEIKNRLASKLSQAMELKCPLRWKRLKDKHAIKDAYGAVISNSFDGIAMFLDEEREANDGDVSEYDAKCYENAYEKLRDTPLKSNVSLEPLWRCIPQSDIKIASSESIAHIARPLRIRWDLEASSTLHPARHLETQ